MAKGFTKHEKNIIKQKLIDSCMECWNRYGYQKTNVAELCEEAGISTGAFYQFFDSKELLFVESAQAFSDELLKDFHEHLQKEPNKIGFANGLKEIIHKMQTMNWFLKMADEWPVIVRKLPPEFMEKDYQGDITRYSHLVEKYGLVPKKSLEEITTILQMVSASLVFKEKFIGNTTDALDFIIDSVVEKLFE